MIFSNNKSTQKITTEIVNTRLAPRGIKLITEFVTTRTKSEFKCDRGHTWVAIVNNVLSANNGCPHCGNRIPLLKEEVNKRLESRNVKIIGEFNTVKVKTLFECDRGHQWESRPNDVLRGNGCPSCAKFGFNIDKPAHLYIFKRDDYLKYGITNNLEQRLKKHQRSGAIDLVYSKNFEHGKLALIKEDLIKNTFGGNYASKEKCPDGYTETLSIHLLNQVLSIL